MKGEEKKEKGIQGRRQLLQTPLIHGVSPNEKAGTNQVAHSSILSCSCRLRQFGFTWPTKMILVLFPAFLLQTFSSNFLWWTFEIHKKAESKINNLLLDSTIFNILLHLLYLHMCKIYSFTYTKFRYIYFIIFRYIYYLFILVEPYFLLKISFF